MFTKSNLLATLAGFFVLYLLGWVFYGVIAEDFFKLHTIIAESHKDESIDAVWQIAIGSIILSFFMSTIYNKWSRGNYNIKNGFEFGALIGALIGIGLGVIMYATVNFMDFTGQIVDGIWSILYYGLAGVAIALTYKATQSEV